MSEPGQLSHARAAVCHEDMGSDPCGKPAVGQRLDPEHGSPYPVCSEHLRPPYPQPDERRWTIWPCQMCKRPGRQGFNCDHCGGQTTGVDVAPVRSAGSDTVDRVAQAVEAFYENSTAINTSEDRAAYLAAYDDLKAAVAAVGPVGRPCHAPAGEACPTPDLCGNLGCSWPVGRSCEVTDEMAEAGSSPIVHDWEIPPVEALPMARAVLEAALRTTAPDGEKP